MCWQLSAASTHLIEVLSRCTWSEMQGFVGHGLIARFVSSRLPSFLLQVHQSRTLPLMGVQEKGG